MPASSVATQEPCSPPCHAHLLLWPVFLIGSTLSSLPSPLLAEEFSLCFPAINELSHVSLPPDRLQIPHSSGGAVDGLRLRIRQRVGVPILLPLSWEL